MISVVIPAYNEENGIKENVNEIIKYLPEDYEIILVDDGSKDSTWSRLSELSEENSKIVSVRFSRNFGKEAALMAGISNASGDAVIIMDSDLQHPPEYIPEMIEKWQDGYRIVETIKKNRGKESIFYKASAGIFYGTLRKLSGLDMANSSDYKLLDRSVVEKIKDFREGQLFFRGLVQWVGYERCVIEIDVHERKNGESKFKLKSLMKLALNAITSFSSSLLYLTAVIGTIFFICAVILGIQTIYNKVTGTSADGFTTVILLQLIIGSLVMFCLAVIGIYVGKIYEEVKHRPQYIISDIRKKA